MFEPHYYTESSQSVRTIGYSPSKRAVSTVITVEELGPKFVRGAGSGGADT
jgi:hypothetical protein